MLVMFYVHMSLAGKWQSDDAVPSIDTSNNQVMLSAKMSPVTISHT